MRRKKTLTTKQFKDKLEEKFPGQFTVIGEYTKSCNPIKIKHNVCDYVWEPIAANVLHKGGCPVCARKKRHFTQEEFEQKVFNIYGDEYSVLGEYETLKHKVLMRHNTCGHEWYIRPEFLLKRGTRCPNCNRGPISEERCQERLDKKFNGNIKIVKFGGGSTKKSILLDKRCNHSFETSINSLLRDNLNINQHCPICKKNKAYALKQKQEDNKNNRISNARKKIESKNKHYVISWDNDTSLSGILTCNKCNYKIHLNQITQRNVLTKCSKCTKKSTFPKCTNDTSLQEAFDYVFKDEYKILEKYEGAKFYMSVKHCTCNTIFKKRVNNMLTLLKQGKHPCTKCGNKKSIRKTNQEIQKDLDDKFGKDEWILIGDYINSDTYVTIKHKCGYEYKILVKTLKEKNEISRCPSCSSLSESNGERKIKQILESNNINFIHQYINHKCKYKQPLRFDFAIFTNNKDISHMIEFDGQQHFKSVDMFGGDKYLEEVTIRDKIKDKFCEQNGIKMIRIGYNQFDDIENILKQNHII